jgi:Flp pilus assembly protein TadD
MARGRRRNQKRPKKGQDRLLKEEQGELLTEALLHVSGRRGAPVPMGPREEVEGTPSTEDPEPEREGGEAVSAELDSGMEGVAEEDLQEVSGPADPVTPVEGAPSELEPSKEVETIPESPWEQKMAWAKERVRESRLEEALELYRELVAENPSSVRALNNLGILLDEMGEHGEAAACLARAQGLDPQNLEVAGNLGAALGALGKYGEAEAQLRRVLRQEPENVGVRANLGILFFRRGLYQQAEEELAAVCRAKPDHGLAFYYRGEALNRLGDVEEAIDTLKRAIELSPMNPRAYYTLGILFDRKNLPEEAAVMYRKSRDLSRR